MRFMVASRGAVLGVVILGAGSGCKKQEEARPPAEEGTSVAASAEEKQGLEDPEESPYLDISNFNQVVESHHPEVVACYRETAGKAADGPMGRVKATLVIDADGRVKQVSFDAQRSTLKDPALHTCIQGKTAQWRFNISLTGADTPMPYTFDFSAGGLLK